MAMANEYDNLFKWEHTDIYCPDCGSQNIWRKDGDGDFYLGVEFICSCCASAHYLENISLDPSEEALKFLQNLANRVVT